MQFCGGPKPCMTATYVYVESYKRNPLTEPLLDLDHAARDNGASTYTNLKAKGTICASVRTERQTRSLKADRTYSQTAASAIDNSTRSGGESTVHDSLDYAFTR